MLTKKEIDEFITRLREFTCSGMVIEDEILSRLYHRLYEQIVADLNMIWFYNNALRKRSKNYDRL